MTVPGTVYLLDFDNTLIDHDRYKRDIDAWLREHAPTPGSERFWQLYEEIRAETEIVDLPETASRFAFEAGTQLLHRELSAFLWDYPFDAIAFPGALNAVRELARRGTTVVLCDGHDAFQRHKLYRSGFAEAAGHRIMVCVHKEHEIAEVERRYPADHYVMLDDKPRIHRALREHLGDRVTTVLVRQGHYAEGVPGSLPGIDGSVPSVSEYVRASTRDA